MSARLTQEHPTGECRFGKQGFVSLGRSVVQREASAPQTARKLQEHREEKLHAQAPAS